MKDNSIQVIAEFESHQLIRMDYHCPHCTSTLFRLFPDGKIDCSNCKNPMLNTELKLESQ